jgi:hypothetical protein
MSSRYFTAADADLFLSRPVDEKVYFSFRTWQGIIATSWMLLPFWLPFLYSLRRAAHAGWGFLAWGFLAPLPLGWIASSLASALVMAAARRFSARKLRNSFGAATAVLAVGLILLLRLIQPEKLASPESAVTLEQFVKTWSPSAHLYDPVALAADSVIMALSDPLGASLRAMLILAMAAGLNASFQRAAGPGFLKAWLDSRELLGGGDAGRGKASMLWAWGGGRLRLLWLKEASAMLRNPVLRLQMLMVGALCGIFLYNLFKLPFHDDQGLKQMLFLPACGFSQLILISVATRFVFPLESVEANGSWMLRVAPLGRRAWLVSRIWIYAPALLVLNAVLVFSCIQAFSPAVPSRGAALLLMAFTPLGVASLTAFLGLAWKQRDVSQPEEITTSPAAVLVMALSLAYVLGQLGIFYLPLHEIERHDLQLMVPLNRLIFVAAGLLWLLLQGAVVLVPMAMASRRMEEAG